MVYSYGVFSLELQQLNLRGYKVRKVLARQSFIAVGLDDSITEEGYRAVAILAGLSVWAEINRQKAVEQQKIAVENADKARKERDRALMTELSLLSEKSLAELRHGRHEAALQLALQSYWNTAEPEPRPWIPESESALAAAAIGSPIVYSHVRPVGTIANIYFDSKTQAAAILSYDGMAHAIRNATSTILSTDALTAIVANSLCAPPPKSQVFAISSSIHC